MAGPSKRSIEGATIAYEAIGPKDAEPILFLHGWTSDRSTFRYQIMELSKTHRCIVLDLPGHGDSEAVPNADYSVDFYRDRLRAFISTLKIEKAALIGHSLGGLLALELLADNESRHPCAILIDPAPMIKTPALLKSLTRTRKMMQDMGREAAQAILSNKVFFRKTDPENLSQEVQDIARRTDDEAALKTWDGIIAYDATKALERVQRPLAFINADRPQNREEDIRAHAPYCFWGRTIGTGHFNHRVMPRQVNAMIIDFLDLAKRL
ncbi:hypothetical protein JCM17845_00600 [Iodidimonas gelatinilytica]|uniref:AB hydrolase-1 domain-containing protein n=1 Tax=Iodidimonas gelatinilytica TaxID=1236966 RepID=A0A5A7MUE3_9PROT|nr:alpha/beta hydrolase [Iodidimonas gelatinilytica]GEQ99436.1 hypothetical protein JCM17845_00600 [Iodidimonas gelatinilytica]